MIAERWIDEDIAVYERLFVEQGSITPRSQTTFEAISEVVRALLPPPELIIYCQCSPATAFKRITARDRQDSRLHTIDYIEQTHALYQDWLSALNGPRVYFIDTEESNLTQPATMEAVIVELQQALLGTTEGAQLSLLPDNSPPPSPPKHLKPYRPDRWIATVNPSHHKTVRISPSAQPVAYLAAPFTGKDTGTPTAEEAQKTLGDWSRAHGVIPRRGFRQGLLAIERSLKELGFVVLLPHRDVNEWGRKLMTPEDAMLQCTKHVEDSDLFVGILGQSCGAHYEFGLARAAGKPCLLLRIDDLPSSFLASGTTSLISADLLEVSSPTFRKAANKIGQDKDLHRFLQRHFAIRTPP